MKQADLGLSLGAKRTRKREYLDEMNLVVPWTELVALVAPFAPEGKKGRPPFAVATMLRIHFMQQWFGLSDPAMEEALFDVPLYWHVAMCPGKRRALDKRKPIDAMVDEVERIKASIRAKVEHPFRVIQRQFGFVKVRYRGLKKNTAQLTTLFALSNLWMVRGKLMGAGA